MSTDNRFMIRNLQKLEQFYTITSRATNLTWAQCDETTFDDQAYLFSREQDAADFCKALNEDNYPAVTAKVEKSQMSGFYTGLYLTDGAWQEIRWQKGDATAPLVLTDLEGNSLKVNPGKSFIAIYLWKMLAELGSRVLLIDCDLRKSEMRTKYGISSAEKITGVAHYLAGKVELQDAVYETNIPNGYMIPLSAPVANRRWKASPTRCTLRPTRTAPSWWCAAAGLPASWCQTQWTN